MKLYKFTDSESKTYGGMQWGENITHNATVKGKDLCTSQVIHAYKDPYMAVFHDPIGGDYLRKDNPQLWVCEGRVVAEDWGKVACKSLTTLKQIQIPEVALEQRVTIAIRCALLVYKEKSFVIWANNWLSGKNRNLSAAWSADLSAASVAWSAAWSSASVSSDWAAASAAASAASVAGSAAILEIIHEVIR